MNSPAADPPSSSPDSDVVAVDWSGRVDGGASHIWLAHVRHGHVLELAHGRNRTDLVAYLVELKHRCPNGLAVGLDFSFSLPAWFVRARGHDGATDLWSDLAIHGESLIARCAPPFWGRQGTHPPPPEQRFRATELVASAGGVRAKSTFQLNGPGTVGTGSLRGMPHLLDLRAAGFAIWPFDEPAPDATSASHVVLELYPRLLTGAVVKRDPVERRRYLDEAPWLLDDATATSAATSEDAFDAVVSALVMYDHRATLRNLHQSVDSVTLLEGAIWDPHNIV